MSKIKKSVKTKTEKKEVIYGVHSIIECLKAKKRHVFSIYTTRPLPKSWSRIAKYLPEKKPTIQYVERNVLDGMAHSVDHRGIVALVSPFKYRSKIFDPKKQPFILLLDSVQDVQNLGAILRSAYCTGVDGIVLCKRSAAPLTSTVFNVSAGLAEYLNVYVASSLNQAVSELSKAGYNIYLTVLKNGKNAMEVEYKKPLCLVIGNEGTGITRSILGSGEMITLPQKDVDISYNASVAAGIFLFLLSQKG